MPSVVYGGIKILSVNSGSNVQIGDTAQNGDEYERDRRDQLEIERLGRFLSGVGPRCRESVDQTRAEQPQEEHRKVRHSGRSAPGLFTGLRRDQRVVGGMNSQRPRRRRNLDQTVKGFIELSAGDSGQDLPDPSIELRLADSTIRVGILEP